MVAFGKGVVTSTGGNKYCKRLRLAHGNLRVNYTSLTIFLREAKKNLHERRGKIGKRINGTF